MRRHEIVVWFSCGAASAVAAYETIRQFGSTYNVRIVNNIVLEEHSDNWRFLRECQEWFGQPIEFATNPKFPFPSARDVWAKRSFMSGPKGAPCTIELKKEARRRWEETNLFDFMVFGFTADEQHRHDMFVLTERSNVMPVLIQMGLTKQDCLDYVASYGLRLPIMYELGFPNANCIGCVKATSPTYWNHVRLHFPAVFADRAIQSRDLGARLVRYNGERIYLDELPVDAVGRPLKSLIMPECGIFCEEGTQERDPDHPRASLLLA